MKLLAAALLMFATAAAADPLRATSIDEARKQMAADPTATVKIYGEMTATNATFYGCAFKDPKAWAALTIKDGAGDQIVVYLKKTDGRSSLASDASSERGARILSATIKAPKQRGKCEIAQYELLKY